MNADSWSAPRVVGWLAPLIRRSRGGKRPPPAPATQTILDGPRRVALVVIAVLVAAASLVSFAESYRGLYAWAKEHGLRGAWAAIWPLQVDVFIAVGELALFVALVDAWQRRSRIAAWAVTVAGLAVSVAGNVGHVTGHSRTDRVTAAVPPLAAAAALAVGLGVLKRVVEHHHATTAKRPLTTVPPDVRSAALAALKATTAAGNPLSARQLETRFGLSRAEATRVRELAAAEQPSDAAGAAVVASASPPRPPTDAAGAPTSLPPGAPRPPQSAMNGNGGAPS